jgi:hypothetical protein
MRPLGNHLQVIEDLQRQAVEQELLRVAIEQVLQETTELGTRQVADQTPEPQLKALITNLVQAFHQDASFGANEEGYLKVTLEPAVIQQKFLELAGNRV